MILLSLEEYDKRQSHIVSYRVCHYVLDAEATYVSGWVGGFGILTSAVGAVATAGEKNEM